MLKWLFSKIGWLFSREKDCFLNEKDYLLNDKQSFRNVPSLGIFLIRLFIFGVSCSVS